MLNVKSRARKQNLGLTVAQATAQARRIADRVMPNAGVTVESRLSHDLATDTAIVITEITFPANTDLAGKVGLGVALHTLTGVAGQTSADSRITITRKR
jgi:hypothetical protein